MIYSNLVTIDEVEQQASDIISDFLQQASFLDSPSVEYSLNKEPGYPGLRHNAESDHSIRVTERDGTFHLAICSEDLLGIPVGALQGWLELKIVLAMIKADAVGYQFNFQDQIMSLMPVAGGSLYFIRELVEHLSRALKQLEATKIIIKMDRGLPQAYYYFYRKHPTAEDRILYKQLLPHNWSRASHLCRKLGDYLALSCLACRKGGFSRMLLSDWQKQYVYIKKDQAFMEKMVSIADHYQDSEFSFRLVEMFKLLKESLLIDGRDDTGPDSHDRMA